MSIDIIIIIRTIPVPRISPEFFRNQKSGMRKKLGRTEFIQTSEEYTKKTLARAVARAYFFFFLPSPVTSTQQRNARTLPESRSAFLYLSTNELVFYSPARLHIINRKFIRKVCFFF